jgi:hypothetical protein
VRAGRDLPRARDQRGREIGAIAPAAPTGAAGQIAACALVAATRMRKKPSSTA